jgi:hypothetical protein
MSLTVATWIGAIATAVLALGAIVTVYYARKAFREQSRELGVLQQQAKDQQDFYEKQARVLALQAEELQASLDERKREALERRQVQAARVFVTQSAQPNVLTAAARLTPRPRVIVAQVQNASSQPVYEVVATWHLGSEPWGDPNPEPLGTALPYTPMQVMRKFPADADFREIGVVIRFRDASGIRWQRRPDGALSEVTT